MYFIMNKNNDGTFRVGNTLDMEAKDWTQAEIENLHSTSPKRVWGYNAKTGQHLAWHSVTDPDDVKAAAQSFVNYFSMQLRAKFPPKDTTKVIHVELIQHPKEEGHWLVALRDALIYDLLYYKQKDNSDLTREMRSKLSAAEKTAGSFEELVAAMDGNLALELRFPDMCDCLDEKTLLFD